MSSGTLNFIGLEFEYEGEFVPPVKERLHQDWGASSPSEGGYFEDFQVFISGVNVTEVLSDDALVKLENMAVEDEK